MRTIGWTLLLSIAGLAVHAPIQAQDYDFVTGLADLIAAENFCGLAYNQAALATLVVEHVPADDMTFTDMLKNLTYMAELRQREFTVSAKTAHCAQIGRLAGNFGLVPNPA